MGVDYLYLNPIFEAHSNHRYNTADYLNQLSAPRTMRRKSVYRSK